MLSVTGAGRSPDAAAPPPQSVPRRSQLAARGSPSAVSARRSVRASTAGRLVCCSHHRPHLRRRRCHRRCHHCHRCRRQRRFVVVALCSKSTRLSDPVAVPGTRCLDSITTLLLRKIRVQAAGVLRGTVLLLRCRRCVLHKPLAEQPRDRRRRPEPHWFCHNTGTR